MSHVATSLTDPLHSVDEPAEREFFHFLFLSHPSSPSNQSKEAVVNITVSDTPLYVCRLPALSFPPSLFILHRNESRAHQPHAPAHPLPPSWMLTQSRLCPRVSHSSALQQFRCENSRSGTQV